MAALLLFCAAPVFAQADIDALAKKVDKIEKSVGAWSFYGQARMATFWNDYNDDAWKAPAQIYGEKDGLKFDLQANSRLGATVSRGNYGGGFEFGLDDTSGFLLRTLYGDFAFSPEFSIMVGQHYTPTCTFISNQTWDEDVNFLFFAPAYNSRRPMIQFKYNGFKFAFVKQHSQAIATGAPADATIHNSFPKLEASYHFGASNFFFDVYGGYQTFKLDSAAGKDYDIDSYIAGLTGGVSFGPAYVRAGGWYGSNYGSGAYGIYTVAQHHGLDKTVIENGEVKDATAYGLALVAGFKASDALSFEGGVGYISQDSDRAGVKNEDEAMGYYLQSVIKLGKGLSFVPEIGYMDFKNGLFGNDQGSMWYAGFKTQIDF